MKYVNYSNLNSHQKINYIFINIQALIAVFGILGNILVIIVLNRKSLSKYSYSFYWKTLACSDIIFLINILRYWADFILDVNLSLVAPIFCHLNEYQVHVFGCMSMWLLSIISFDRFVVIVHPNSFKAFKKHWFKFALISILFVYSMLINIRLPLNSQLLLVENGSKQSSWVCYLPEEVFETTAVLFTVNILLANIVVNNILHVVIFRHIYLSRRTSLPLSRSLARHKRIMGAVTGLNIASFTSKIPMALGIFLANYYSLDRDQSQMILTITMTFGICDNADLFYVNMLVNSIFRKELLKMIGLQRRGSSRRRFTIVILNQRRNYI